MLFDTSDILISPIDLNGHSNALNVELSDVGITDVYKAAYVKSKLFVLGSPVEKRLSVSQVIAED